MGDFTRPEALKRSQDCGDFSDLMGLFTPLMFESLWSIAKFDTRMNPSPR